MLLLWGGNMRETYQRDSSECVVWNRLRSKSHFVALVFADLMLSRLGRLNTCLNPYLFRVSPVAVVLQCHREVLERENANEVRNALPLLKPNSYSILMTSQLYCQKEEGTFLMTQTFIAFQKPRRILLSFVEMVAAVVLRLSSSRVPANLHIIFCNWILVFRVFSLLYRARCPCMEMSRTYLCRQETPESTSRTYLFVLRIVSVVKISGVFGGVCGGAP